MNISAAGSHRIARGPQTQMLAAAVRRQVTLLDWPKYAAREAAVIVLRALGDEIVPLLLRIDAASLSPEQSSRVAGVLAGRRRRLTPVEAAGLRKDCGSSRSIASRPTTLRSGGPPLRGCEQ
jgi:hypothetical protein